jgi:hypothetical protein
VYFLNPLNPFKIIAGSIPAIVSVGVGFEMGVLIGGFSLGDRIPRFCPIYRAFVFGMGFEMGVLV